mmetsp:Transcript_17797/g.12745  ORF Transcript_17797/g.12745 Transcript_17797/m.12745 type:complete len:103 (+) Transcript_17797:992-1300(+)
MSAHDPILDYNLKIWDQWLTEDAKKEYQTAGYYSQKLVLKDGTETNTHLIAINTESCYIFNFYLMSLRNDPGFELDWFESKLAELEANGESAILLGHVPVGE